MLYLEAEASGARATGIGCYYDDPVHELLGLAEAIRRYWNFYLLTSFGWDLMRSVCNAVVIAILGRPLLAALLRFRERFSWERATSPPSPLSHRGERGEQSRIRPRWRFGL